MTRLEIIDRLCGVTETLAHIVRKQREIIERDKIENAAAAELTQMEKEAEAELDLIEYGLRPYCDTDDVEREVSDGDN